MKLLFDNNLSHKLVQQLNDIFPDSTHVMFEHLDKASDHEIWSFAKQNSFTIATKDADFNEMILLKGFPPKVIWLRIGNCSVSSIAKSIRDKSVVLSDFYDNENFGIIEVE